MITNHQIQKAADALLRGEMIVYPTETAYALGVNALDPEALEKMYALKGRDDSKPTHICVSTIQDAQKYAYVSDTARHLAKAFLPGPLTLVMPTKGVLPALLEESGKGTQGIRIPDHPVAQKLMEDTKIPITAASANVSDDAPPYSIDDVKKSFGEDYEKIAVVLDNGVLPQTSPSTLLSLMGDEPTILREGPISMDAIQTVLKT